MLSYYDLTRQLKYDPHTGIFTWKVKRKNNVVGDVAGFKPTKQPYLFIRVCNKDYRAHRLAWFYMTKKWPKMSITFANKNPLDLRFVNLKHEDCYGVQERRRTSKYLTGVSYRGRKYPIKPWYARISVKNQVISLGYHATERKAHKAYLKARKDIRDGVDVFTQKISRERGDVLSSRRTLREPAR